MDIKPQPHYPFKFIQADALTFSSRGFDVIHASPPCQRYSAISKGMGYSDKHPDLVAATRLRLRRSRKPWVMENVVGAPFLYAVQLCGTQFDGLRVYRHRLFETSHLMFSPGPCRHKRYKPIGVYGETIWDSSGRSTQRPRGPRKGEWRPAIATTAQGQAAMGID